MGVTELKYEGEGMVRDATFVEFTRTFGFHKGHYRVQMADAPVVPFGDRPWHRDWYKTVLGHSIQATPHSVRTPKMLVDNDDFQTVIIKQDQQTYRKNYDRYGWYERVYVDALGHVNEYSIQEKGKAVNKQVPRDVKHMKFQNIKSGALEHDIDHAYIVAEVSKGRVWTPPSDMCLYVEYCVGTEVWRNYARAYNNWDRKIRFLREGLGLPEVCLCMCI